jgi:hypothetical protein
MPIRWAVASGNFSNLAIWNDSGSLGFPTASDDIWANNNNINIDQSFTAISLNSTARARTIATPQMTSNIAPSPYVAASSFAASAWQAFDRNTTTTALGTGMSGWISMDFGSGSSVVIDGYTVFGSSTQVQNPRNWTLEGSNDNSSWTVLHTVTQASAIVASGNYSVASIGNSVGYRYYRLNISANGGNVSTSVAEIELYERGTAALAAGGSFIFNSGSISGSVTSTTAALSAGATNLIQVTAATGSTVTLSLGSAVTAPAISVANLINHSGNCNFNLNGTIFNAVNTISVTSTNCISKSSTGTITIIGDLIGSTGGNQNTLHALNSTNGNTVVIGNVRGGTISGLSYGINQTAGNVTITGNVTAQAQPAIVLTGASSQFTIIGNITGGTATSAHGINFTGTSGSVTGTVTGGAGSGAHGINATGIVSITGNVVGSAGGGLVTNNNATIIGNVTGGSIGAGATISTSTPSLTFTVTGTVVASSTIGGILLGVGGGVGTQICNLTGNMINVAGKQAIFAQNLFISDTATTQWRLFTPGGQDKTLYSADTFPNQPTPANVRSGSLFGPSNVLSGSMVVPSPSDVRVNVLTDNTVGTGQSLTAADFLAAISASADPYAQRLRNVATVDTVGSLLTGFNNGGF